MENTSYFPVRKQQVNHDWSDVQTTEFEKPVHNWEPVQTIQYEKPVNNWEPVRTTQYEKPVNNWGPVQTTPIEKGVITTRHEAQSHTWSPIQTARYGSPVFWGTSNQPIYAESNMALRHQVFDESEDGSVKSNDESEDGSVKSNDESEDGSVKVDGGREADDNGGQSSSNETTLPVTSAGVTLGDDGNDVANAVNGDIKTNERDIDARPKTIESEASHTPPATPSSPSKGILRPARRNSSPVSVHFTEDTFPPAPGPPEPPESSTPPKLGDKSDKKSKKKDARKDKKLERKVEKKAKEKTPEPAKPVESEKDVDVEPSAQVEEADKAEKLAKSEKTSKPEKASKSSSKNQKKRDKGGKGRDKGKSKAVVASIISGTSDALLSDGNTTPLTEPLQPKPNPLDVDLSLSHPLSESEPNPEPAVKNAEPSDPSLPTEVKETGEPAVDDSTSPSVSLPPEAEPVELSEPPAEFSPAHSGTEPPNEPADQPDLIPISETNEQSGAAKFNNQPGESDSSAPPEPLIKETEAPLPRSDYENFDEIKEATEFTAPEPVETPADVEGSQESNGGSTLASVAEIHEGTEAPAAANAEEATAPPINDESLEPQGEDMECTDYAGNEDAEDTTKDLTPDPNSIPSTSPLPTEIIEESEEILSSGDGNDLTKDVQVPVEVLEPEVQEQAKSIEISSSEEIAQEDPVLETQTVDAAALEEKPEKQTPSSSEQAPETVIEPSESAHEHISEPDPSPSEPIEDKSEEHPFETGPVENEKVEEPRGEKFPAEETIASGENKNEEAMGDSTPSVEIAAPSEETKPSELSSEFTESGSGGDVEDEIKNGEAVQGTKNDQSALSNDSEPPSESTEAEGTETEPSALSEYAEPPCPEATEQEETTETEPSAPSEDAEPPPSETAGQEKGVENEPSAPSEDAEPLPSETAEQGKSTETEPSAPSSETVADVKDELSPQSSESEAKEEVPASKCGGEPPTEDPNNDITASKDPMIESSSPKIEVVETALGASSQESQASANIISDQPAGGESSEPPSSAEPAGEENQIGPVSEIGDNGPARDVELVYDSVISTEETPHEPSDENSAAATDLVEQATNGVQIEESQSLEEAPKTDESKNELTPPETQGNDEPSPLDIEPVGESEASVVEAVKEPDPEGDSAPTEPEISVEHAGELETPLEDVEDLQQEPGPVQVVDEPQEEFKVDASDPEPDLSSDQPTPAPTEAQNITEPAVEMNDPEVNEMEEHKSDSTLHETPESESETGPALIHETPAPEAEEAKVNEEIPQKTKIANEGSNAEQQILDNDDYLQVKQVEVDDAVTPATEELPPQVDGALQPETCTDSNPEDTHSEPKSEQEAPVIEEAAQEEPKPEPEAAITEETAEPVPADNSEESSIENLIDQESMEKNEEDDSDPTPVPGDASAEVIEDSKDAVPVPDELELCAPASEEEKALDSTCEPETPLGEEDKQEDEALVPRETATPEPNELVLAVEEVQSLVSDDSAKGEPETSNEELTPELVPDTEDPIETPAPPNEDTSQIAREAPDADSGSTEVREVQEAASEDPLQIEPGVIKEAATVPLSKETVEATLESEGLPVAEIAAGLAVGAIAATILESNDSPAEPEALCDQPIMSELEQLAEVIEERAPGEPPSPGSNRRRKHRSSRYSKGSSRQSSSRDGPSEEVRPPLHRRRRESENSLKNLFFAPPSPKKSSRHDSGFSAGSTSPRSRKYRSDRTPEEQAAHEQRKVPPYAAKPRAADSGAALVDEPATELATSSISTRRSSTRRHSSSRSSKARDGNEKKPKLLDMKGESVIKAKFIAIDKPHVKETVSTSSRKPIPIINRPRFSMDGERSKNLESTSSSRHHHSHRSSNSRNDKEYRDRHKIEEEKELRKAREETERQRERARAAVAEESRAQQERDDAKRTLRREARRRKSEEEERANDDSPEASTAGSKGKLVKDNRKYPSRRSERERERERERSKSKGPLKSLWSSAKKVFG